MVSISIKLICTFPLLHLSTGFAPIRQSSLSFISSGTNNQLVNYSTFGGKKLYIIDSHKHNYVSARLGYNHVQPIKPISVMKKDQTEMTSSSLEKGGNDKKIKDSFTTPFDKPILAALDCISITVFAAVGKASHSPDGSLDIGAVFTTAFPFLVSWFVTSPLTGVYNNVDEDGNDDNDFVNALKATLKGWAVAVPLGCIGRGIIKGYVPPLPFVIVTLIATLVILSTFRLLYTAVEKQIE